VDWKRAQNRSKWRQLVETDMLIEALKGASPDDDDDDDDELMKEGKRHALRM